MQIISKGFLRRKAEPSMGSNSKQCLCPQLGRRNVYDYISYLGICAKDHPTGPFLVLAWFHLQIKNQSGKGPKVICGYKGYIQVPVS